MPVLAEAAQSNPQTPTPAELTPRDAIASRMRPPKSVSSIKCNPFIGQLVGMCFKLLGDAARFNMLLTVVHATVM